MYERSKSRERKECYGHPVREATQKVRATGQKKTSKRTERENVREQALAGEVRMRQARTRKKEESEQTRK